MTKRAKVKLLTMFQRAAFGFPLYSLVPQFTRLLVRLGGDVIDGVHGIRAAVHIAGMHAPE